MLSVMDSISISVSLVIVLPKSSMCVKFITTDLVLVMHYVTIANLRYEVI